MDRRDDFDEQEEMGEQAPAHIWLRYATQFTAGERTYTIDIGIPVPRGADAQTREQLLREADAGLDQLANYVERRVMQVSQQSAARPTPAARPSPPPLPAPTPAAAPTPISLPVPTPAVQSEAKSSTAGTSGSTSKPQMAASTSSAPSTPASQPALKKQPGIPATPATPVPADRPNIGASMPPSPSLPAGTLSLPEFLKYLKEMGLDAKSAMAMLNVKSLSGLNLREALEQLQHILMQEGENPATASGASMARSLGQTATRMPTGPQAPTQSQPSSSRSPQPTQANPSASNPPNPTGSNQTKAGASKSGASAVQTPSSTPPASPNRSTPTAPSATHSMPTPISASGADRQARPTPSVSPAAKPAPASGAKNSASEPRPLTMQEDRLPYTVPVVFDEEEDDEAGLEDFDFDEDEEEQESSFGAGIGLSAADRGSAQNLVSRLREAGGSSAVSPTRLKVLHNIIDGQLTPEQLQALIHGVWGAASDKKLKSDQAEALISWGKQDDFVTEAEMVLALFEEDGNASSNR